MWRAVIIYVLNGHGIKNIPVLDIFLFPFIRSFAGLIVPFEVISESIIVFFFQVYSLYITFFFLNN